jgi:hypothetical protein
LENQSFYTNPSDDMSYIEKPIGEGLLTAPLPPPTPPMRTVSLSGDRP